HPQPATRSLPTGIPPCSPAHEQPASLRLFPARTRGFFYQLVCQITRPGRTCQSFENAVEPDPGYADAYAALGFLDWLAYAWQWDREAGVLDRAAELANKSIALDDSNAVAYFVRGWVAATKGQREKALADAEQAVSADPNLAEAWAARADIN